MNEAHYVVLSDVALDGKLDRMALLRADNSIAVVDVSSNAILWTMPKPRSGFTYTNVALSPDGKFVGAILTNLDQIPEPTQAISQLLVWKVGSSGAPAVAGFRNTAGLGIEGFEFSSDDNTVIAWQTAYGQLDIWLFNLTTRELPPSLPHQWGENSVVAYNSSLDKLVIELGTATPAGWEQIGLHAHSLGGRVVELAPADCIGPPGAAVSDDGTAFGCIGYKQTYATSVWSVSPFRKIQSWKQETQFSGSMAFFDGSLGVAEAQGSHEGINLVTTIDLYRVSDHKIVGQYTLRPVPHWSSELTSLEVYGGVLIAIEPTGEKSTNQGFIESYAYYAFPLPALN